MKTSTAALLVWVSLVSALPASALAVTVPADVKAFGKRTEGCDKLAASTPKTEKELAAIDAKIKKQGCDRLEDEEKKLRWKYRNRLKVLDAIEEIVKKSNDVGGAEDPVIE